MSKFVIMGVCGCGKSTVAELLAKRLHGTYLDGDDFHPEANRKKMSSGKPLNDHDRLGWLQTLAAQIRDHDDSNGPLFLACSALKESYRNVLRGNEQTAEDKLRFIYLHGEKQVLESRLKNRIDHFMPTSLLESQLSTLEIPENEIVVDIDMSAEQLVDKCVLKIAEVIRR